MVARVLTTQNLLRTWKPEGMWGHAVALGPMLAHHEALRLARLQGESGRAFSWEWDTHGVELALANIWRMTGRWKARRAVTVERDRLEAVVTTVVPRLCRILNRASIRSLWDLVPLKARDYSHLATAVHDAVTLISRTRETAQVEPVLGSKVLHHFFPSIVPVFDTALIRNRVLRTQTFKSFLASEREWFTYEDAQTAGGRGMLEFHHYFALCAGIGTRPAKDLDRVRYRFGLGLRRVAPVGMDENPQSLLWFLDAKIAEYCLLGQATKEATA